jgi:phosphate transport system permease protein
MTKQDEVRSRTQPPTDWRRITDRLGSQWMGGMATSTVLLVACLILALLVRTWPILQNRSLSDLLLGISWHPLRGEFGFKPFIVGTLWVTGLSMVLAVPICALCAIYLAEYAPRSVTRIIKPLIDLLAGIPSVVYGVWGTLTVVPFIRSSAGPGSTITWDISHFSRWRRTQRGTACWPAASSWR